MRNSLARKKLIDSQEDSEKISPVHGIVGAPAARKLRIMATVICGFRFAVIEVRRIYPHTVGHS
jgi:hypothetical protein